MSESIKGMIPDLDEESSLKDCNDSFLIASIDLSEDDQVNILVGSVSGVSFENMSEIKLDVRASIDESFKAIKKYVSTGLSCRMLYLYLGNNELFMEGPYSVSFPKMMDFDHQNKMCTLCLDLIKS